MKHALYDIRWHNAQSHLLGSCVESDPVVAMKSVALMLERKDVTTVVVWLGSNLGGGNVHFRKPPP